MTCTLVASESVLSSTIKGSGRHVATTDPTFGTKFATNVTEPKIQAKSIPRTKRGSRITDSVNVPYKPGAKMKKWERG